MAKAPQLHPISVSQGRNDLIEDRVNQPSRPPLSQMWALSRNTEYQLGFDA